MKILITLSFCCSIVFSVYAVDKDFDVIRKKYNLKKGSVKYFEVLTPKRGFIGSDDSYPFEYVPKSEKDYDKFFLKFSLHKIVEIVRAKDKKKYLRIIYKIDYLSNRNTSGYSFFCIEFFRENTSVLVHSGYAYTDKSDASYDPVMIFSNVFVGLNNLTTDTICIKKGIIVDCKNYQLTKNLSQKTITAFNPISDMRYIGNRVITSYYNDLSRKFSNTKGTPLVLIYTELQWWSNNDCLFNRMVRFNSQGYIQFICREIKEYPAQNKKE